MEVRCELTELMLKNSPHDIFSAQTWPTGRGRLQCICLLPFTGLKIRKQVENGIAYAKPHINWLGNLSDRALASLKIK